MGTLYWRGGAKAVAQVSTVQITAYDAATTYKITIGGIVVSVAGTTDANGTASALAIALGAKGHAYFEAMTYSASTDTVTITANVMGVPFTATSSVTGGTGTIGAVTDTTSATGPNHWDEAENWDTGAIPVNSDDVIIPTGSVPIRWGLGQGAVTLTSLTSHKGYTGEVGLRSDVFATSSDGRSTSATPISEYRETHLTILTARADLGENFGPTDAAGSTMFNLDTGTTEADIVVHDTASSGPATGINAVNLLVNKNTTTVDVINAPGGCGIAALEPGETSTISALTINSSSPGSKVETSSGVTVTTVRQNAGSSVIDAAATITTLTQNGGTLRTVGDYTVTTLNANGGTTLCNHIKTSGNAITTANIQGGALNGLTSPEARTWATVNLKRGVLSANSRVTITTLNEGDSRPYRLELNEV